MSDRIKKIKIKKQDGTFSDYIPIGADAENIDTTDGESVEIKLNKKPYYYDSVADMKADTKLKMGDMVITLGYYEANDGYGEFYKIRNITSSDIVDNINIIALQVSNTLIAERIANYYIEENKINIDNITNNLNNKNYGLLAISGDINSLAHYLYYSSDGENFKRVGNRINSINEDSNAIILIGNRYYVFGNNSYYYSDDLINWSDGIMINDNSGMENWGFYPFYDEVNNKYYVFSALQYKTGTFINAVGTNTLYFKVIKQEFTINDGLLLFGEKIDVKYEENESYIDCAICYDSTYGYTLAIKNENTCKIELYTTNDLSNIGNSYAYLDGAGTEAPQLIDEDGFITMYCQDYALNSRYITGLSDDMGQTYSKVIIATPSFRVNTENLVRHVCKAPIIFRHAGIMKCDKKSLNIITSIGIKETPLFVCSDYAIVGNLVKQTFCTTGGATYNLPNLPYALYILGGGSEITLMNINVKKYYDTSLKLFLGPTNIKFGGDTTNTSTITTDALYNDGIIIECPALPNKYINLPYK